MAPLSSPNTEVVPISLEEEVKSSYLDYAMSVIVSRAIPDVRDGLKPVHRRILFAMVEAGYTSTKPFRKSARIVGDVLGKYHPHGADPIYEAMVRMAQDFSMRLLLVEGQGNFGSVDGDRPAASRYTEARLQQAAHFLLDDYDKDTVDFQKNYDETLLIPTVLPARFPHVLINGGSGIAVGMATNIPPHNLGEVLDACYALVDNPHLETHDLMTHVLGPDFPTGGIILGKRGIKDAYEKGRGSILMRGKCHVDTLKKDRNAIIITELPYQVNKARLCERIAELVNHKEIEGISDLRDESDRDGMRIVIELKRDVVPDVVLNRLYLMTNLQTSFGANLLALHEGRPQQMNLKEILQAFLRFREEVIVRRTRFYLKKAREKAQLLLGLVVAISHIDAVVALIKRAKDTAQARENLMGTPWPYDGIKPYLKDLSWGIEEGAPYYLSHKQAQGILDLRLHRLTNLEHTKLLDELKALIQHIHLYLSILSSRNKLLELMKEEFREVRERFANPRRTALENNEAMHDEEALIQREDMVVTCSLRGYIKRVSLSTYRLQKRGGRGKSAMATREEDILCQVFVASTHAPLLFFSSLGKVYQLKVYQLPIATPQSRGKSIMNLLPFSAGESLSTLLHVPELIEEWSDLDVVFVTSWGNIRRNALADFSNLRANGKIAMKLEDGEHLIAVKTCRIHEHVLLTTKKGRCIRFEVQDVRQFSGRTSTGVRGIRLVRDDEVIAMTVLDNTSFSSEEKEAYLRQSSRLRRGEEPIDDEDVVEDDTPLLPPHIYEKMASQEQFILTVSEKGYGKRTSSYAYRCIGRGGQGVTTMEVNKRNGSIISSFPVKKEENVILLTDKGQLIRCPVQDIRIASRRTQGVTLFRLDPDEKVVSVVCVSEEASSFEEDGSDDA